VVQARRPASLTGPGWRSTLPSWRATAASASADPCSAPPGSGDVPDVGPAAWSERPLADAGAGPQAG
jgi:hypothetical protein